MIDQLCMLCSRENQSQWSWPPSWRCWFLEPPIGRLHGIFEFPIFALVCAVLSDLLYELHSLKTSPKSNILLVCVFPTYWTWPHNISKIKLKIYCIIISKTPDFLIKRDTFRKFSLFEKIKPVYFWRIFDRNSITTIISFLKSSASGYLKFAITVEGGPRN